MKINSSSQHNDSESEDISDMEQYRPKMLSLRQKLLNERAKKIICGLIILILILWWFFFPRESPPEVFHFDDPYYHLSNSSDVTTLEPIVLQEILAKDQSVLPNSMLIGIFTSSRDFQRRHLLRTQQIEPYKSSKVTFRFILGIPPLTYRQSLVYENITYGDLIILENVPDTYYAANSYKTFEYFKYVEQNLNTFKYIGKMDTDTFLSIPDFLEECFNQTVQKTDLAIIGNWIHGGVLPWAQGAFYVLSWKVSLIINRLYDTVARRTRHEDFQVALFLYDAKIDYNHVAINEDRSYDRILRWPIDYNAYRVHKIKDESTYLMITSCFTPQGVNKTQIDYWKGREWEPEE